MAITITSNSNPLFDNVGKKETDATIINSGLSGGTTYYYEIRRYDQQGSTITLNSGQDTSLMANVIGFTTLDGTNALKIILEFRTEYQVRVQKDSAGWSAWKWFKTRDKKYSTPDEINQLRDLNKGSNATVKTNVTQNIANTAKTLGPQNADGVATDLTPTSFTNSQKANMGDVTDYSETDAGATVTTGNAYPAHTGSSS